MSDPQRYGDLAFRLGAYGYAVRPTAQGYLVTHRSNLADVSHARHLDDLADLADLVEWAARRFERTKAVGGHVIGHL